MAQITGSISSSASKSGSGESSVLKSSPARSSVPKSVFGSSVCSSTINSSSDGSSSLKTGSYSPSASTIVSKESTTGYDWTKQILWFKDFFYTLDTTRMKKSITKKKSQFLLLFKVK